MTLNRLRLVLWLLVGVAALAATGLYAYTTMTRSSQAAGLGQGDYQLVATTGEPFTREFRLYLSVADKLVSPWHSIPLFHDEQEHVMNMVVEVPRWENTKLKVSVYIC